MRVRHIFTKKNDKEQILNPELLFREGIYLIVLAMFLMYYFVRTIKYPSGWFDFDYNYIHTFLFVYVFFKYAIMDRTVFGNKTWIFLMLLLFSFAISYRSTGYIEVLDTALLILGAKNVRYTSILKLYLAIKVPLILLTIIGSQIGMVENLIYNQNGRIRESFGFGYPTDFAAQVFFVIATWSLIRQVKISYFELLCMFLVAFFLKISCDARCSVLCILLLIGGVLFLKLSLKIPFRQGIPSLIGRIIPMVCIIAPYLFGIAIILLCRFYNPNNFLMAAINNMTSQRLKLGKKTFDNYDVKLFGQYIEMRGNGGSIKKPIEYTFIDSSYINILMRFGLLVFFIVLILITILMLKNYHNFFVLGVIVLICLHSVIEQHLFEILYNVTLLLPFSLFQSGTNPFSDQSVRKSVLSKL